MGNYFYYYQNQYEDIILNVNSFYPTDKKLNYVIFRVEPQDDTDDDDDEFQKYINRYYR
jgi:hypothetical protein